MMGEKKIKWQREKRRRRRRRRRNHKTVSAWKKRIDIFFRKC
jgi:hypothetical protein